MLGGDDYAVGGGLSAQGQNNELAACRHARCKTELRPARRCNRISARHLA